MNKKLKRTLIGLSLIALSMIYAFFIEPNWIEVTHHKIKIGETSKTIKIAQISDLHTKGLGYLEKNLIEKISTEKPDAIFITGDLATPGGTSQGYRDVLKQFKAPLGVYFITGNWEEWEPIPELSQILKEARIENLTNQKKLIVDRLWIVGFEDDLTKNPKSSTLTEIPTTDHILAFFHSPSFFKKIESNIDLAFSGHTHGGQVRIPLIGHIVLPPGSDNYDAGWFQGIKSKMYVNRGIGTSILPIRMFCRPELSIFEIQY